MKTFGRWVACIIYIIAVAAVCGYILFPEDTAKRYIIAQIQRVNPDLVVTIDGVSPMFPPGLRLRGCDLDYRSQDLLRADEIRVFPALLSLPGELKNFSFQIDVHSGKINGRSTVSTAARAPRFEMDAEAGGVRLEHVPLIKALLQNELHGRLNGRFHYSSNTAQGSILNARIDINDLAVSLDIPGFSLERADFEHVQADIRIDNGRIQVTKLTLSGPILDGRLSGGGVLNRNLWESTIELKGTLEPKFDQIRKSTAPETGGKGSRISVEAMTLPVTIYGALNNLRFLMK
jgi:type II secretion system protein N